MSIFPFHQLSSNPSPALVMHHQTHRLSVLEKGWGFFLRGSVVIQGRKELKDKTAMSSR
ncbi:hypothetical protein NC651_000971 [Populus alba x Populus x berolinensis]|nr:hypothetical protein NC651_000971 [Populus alba x Populus x berolinensis]